MKVMCVRRKSKKWGRFTPIECKHKDCTAAAVARRIQGPVTLDIQNMVESLKNVYNEYIIGHSAGRSNAMLQQIASRGFYNGDQWEAQQMLLPQTIEEEVQDEADSKGGSKPDRG